jgi:peptide methionine sulfoxide reductase msrA/msrB
MTAYFFKIIMIILSVSLSSWGEKQMKPTKEELKKKLTPEQYTCTQEAGTETPFHNKYWNNKEDGIYTDVVNGEPLFSSLDKYDSGSGWPSFTKPLEQNSLETKKDSSLGVNRTEVRSKNADSHLGHLFDDGPPGSGGHRYCINSASLNFIPVDKLKENNFGKYLFQFAAKKGWEIATLAGGCFWGVEDLIQKHPGVIETLVGYTGGKSDSPTYNLVKTGASGHAESVRVLFDPKKLKYEDLLLLFFKLHDPTSPNRQGNDIGTQYRSAIFFESEEQHRIAEIVKLRVEKSLAWKKPLVTEITSATKFWGAEEYHQKYLVKHTDGYTCHFIRDIKF